MELKIRLEVLVVRLLLSVVTYINIYIILYEREGSESNGEQDSLEIW